MDDSKIKVFFLSVEFYQERASLRFTPSFAARTSKNILWGCRVPSFSTLLKHFNTSNQNLFSLLLSSYYHFGILILCFWPWRVKDNETWPYLENLIPWRSWVKFSVAITCHSPYSPPRWWKERRTFQCHPKLRVELSSRTCTEVKVHVCGYCRLVWLPSFILRQ